MTRIAAPDGPNLTYSILGPLAVTRGDEPIPLGSARQRLLLGALLVNNNETVSPDRLIDAVWGEALPANPSASLHTLVSRLRSTLGGDQPDLSALERVDGGYRLTVTEGALDADRFETLVARAEDADPTHAVGLLVEALALWRGPALEELGDLSSAREESVRLDELRLGAIERLGRAQTEAGDPGAAVAVLEALVAEHPLREQALGWLMEALYRAGRHSEALGRYQAYRAQLAEELGLEPSPELRQLELRILDHEMDAATPAASPRTNLPARRVTLVGREDELGRVADRLSAHPIVTIVGPGGVGKTTLAVEVGWRHLDDFTGGVWLCQLAQVRTRQESVAAILSIRERAGGPGRGVGELSRAIGDQPALVILDNCEHVLEAAADAAEELCAASPGMTVLATSREALAARGEAIVRLAGLDHSTPDSPAVALLLDRAQATATAPNAAEARDVARRLEGIPLAIELAAPRLATMSMRELDEALDDQIRVLRARRAAEQRQATMEDAIAWSFDLLEPEQRRVLTAVSVFVAPFTSEAAQAVASGDLDTALHRLVEQSMIVRTCEAPRSRYRLLEPIRQFAWNKLDAADQDRLRDEHGSYFARRAENLASALHGTGQAVAAADLDAEWPDLRRALAWGREQRQATIEIHPLLSLGRVLLRQLGREGLDAPTPPLATQSMAERYQALDDQIGELRARRAAEERQATMEDAIAWSFELLEPEDRRVLSAVSVFVAPFTSEAAQAVASGDLDVALNRLVEQSLIIRTGAGQRSRMRLLEPIRQYAWTRLDHGDQDRLRSAHADHFAGRAEHLSEALRGAGQAAAAAELETEWPDLRQALAWGRDRRNPNVAIRPLLGLGRALLRQLGHEGFDHLDAAVEAMPVPAELAHRTNVVGALGLISRRDLEGATRLLDATEAEHGVSADSQSTRVSLLLAHERWSETRTAAERWSELAAAAGDDFGRVTGELMATFAAAAGDPLDPTIDARLDAGDEQARGSGIPSAAMLAAMARGVTALGRSDHELARAKLLDARSLARLSGDRWIATLCEIAERGIPGSGAPAAERLRRAGSGLAGLVSSRDIGLVTLSLRTLVLLLDETDQPQLAAQLVGALDPLSGGGPAGALSPAYPSVVAELRDRLGDEFDEQRRSGASLSPAEIPGLVKATH